MKICKSSTGKKSQTLAFPGKLYLILLFILSGFFNLASAQVTVTATAGIPAGSYPTVKAAFDAINSGDHKGNIIVNITASTNEGTTPATLNSSHADPANYNSVLIQPVANNVVVSGNPAAGFAVIQFNGSDNVTINGDNPNIGGQARALTINNIAAPSIAAGACIRLCTSASVLSADNISILNCNLNGNVINGNVAGPGTSTNISFGIYAGGNGGATVTSAPTAISSAMEAAAAGTTIRSLVVQNNAINQCGRAVVFNGANTSISNGVSITQNIIGTAGALGIYPYATPVTTVYTNGIWVAGTTGLTITDNTISNILSYVTASLSAIDLSANIAGSIDISNNTISGVVSNTSSNLASGISVNSVTGTFTIADNNISTIENISTTAAGGIRINSANGTGTISGNRITGIFNRNTGGGPAQGINLGLTPSGIMIKNNFISDIMNVGSTSFGNAANANGILLNSGNNHKVYHNSVNLFGTSTSSGNNSINCLAITANSQTGIDIRNNIFSNTVNGGAASDAHNCLFFPFGASAGMKLKLNNNAYYTGNTAGLHGIAFAGSGTYSVANLYTVANFNPFTTAGATNWRNFASLTGNSSNELASFGSTAAAPFTGPTDLHIPAATATALESGGVALPVTTDIDAAPRSGSFPDIGADEFSGTIQDATAPLISYTALTTYTCTLVDRTLIVTITDPSGVPISGTGLPVLYWSINPGPYVPVTATFIGLGQYQFNFGAGVVLGDVVRYYIVAEDNAGNVIASPSAGATGYTAGPPAAATPPAVPESYNVQNVLAAGTYNVGIGQTYTTITAAVNDYNTSCLGGAIIFRLMDAGYPGETFPITIGNPEASAVNTLEIHPNNLAVTVTGNSASALFKLNGADYVTLDGLNTGFNSWSIINTNPSGSVVWIASAGAANGSTHNTIKNCRFTGGGTATAFAGIVSADGSSTGITAEAPNSNNSITGNSFKSLLNGIYLDGSATTPDQAWTIGTNNFGSTIATEKLGLRGIFVKGSGNFTFVDNTIAGITASSASYPAGIVVSDNVSDGLVTRNKISDVKQGSGSGGCYGIELASSINASNITISNNFIWDISADGSSTLANNGNGIVVNSAGGYKIYHNSINLVTNQVSTSSITAAIRISEAVTLAGALDVRNNIFSNTTTVGAAYSIYNESSAAIFSNINFNDYWSGASPVLGFLEGDALNLSGWQAATGQDAKSVSINPAFASAVNLHLAPSSQLNNLGTVIPAVTNDIDNTPRGNPTDIGADEFDAANCSGTPFAGPINVSSATLCNSGSVILTANGFAANDGQTYQWQYSTDGFTTIINDLVGQTTPTNAVSGIINVTTSFRLKITCSNSGLSGYSGVKVVTVNAPVVSTTTAGSRCGTGTVNLAATTVTGGAVLNWYNGPSGGTSLGTGTTFTTPVIAATTNYYVSSSLGSTSGSVGPASPSAEGGAIGPQNIDWKVYFDVLQNGTLISLDIFPKTAGLSSTLYVKNAAGTTLGTYAYTTAYSGGATAQTITINLAMTPGSGYYFEGPGTIQNLYRNTSGATYPYTSPVINITGNAFDNSYYMCYYNLKYSGTCASARTMVTATVTPAPSITAVATPAIICTGASSALSVTSGNAAYSYVWTPGSLPGANVSVSPAATTSYVVTANDGTCSTKDTVVVTVRPLPTAVIVTPAAATVCVNSPATLLTASGGTLLNVTALSENFNAATNAWTPVNNSAGGIPANAAWTLRPNGHIYTTPTAFTFNSNDASQFYLSNSHAQGSGSTTNTILESPAFSLTGYTTANLSFWHHFKYSGGESAIVEISTDGSIWNPLPGGTYSSDQGNTNSFVNANLNMDPYVGQATVYIRFVYSNAIFAWWWAIDNIRVSGSVDTDITWTQAPVAPNSLFSDASASIPYIAGTVINTVYTQPVITTVYTATATGPGPSNCKSSSTATITVTPAVSVSIVANLNPVCPSTNVTFTATPVNGGPGPNYQWQVNGANVGTNSSTYSYIPSDGDQITVVMIGNGVCTFGNPATSNIITMGVLPPTAVDVSITSNSGNFICVGTNVTFTAHPVNGGLIPAYQWKLNGANVATGPTYTTNTLANGDQVICVLTSNSTCISGSNTATSAQILMTVNPYGPPGVVIGIFANSTTICAGTTVTVRATPLNQGLAPTYEFFLNTVSQGIQTSNDFVFTPVNGDKIKVRMVGNYMCRTGPTDTSNSNTLTMTVLASAPASVTMTNTPTFCSGSSITFTANPTNGGLTPAYDFLLNGTSVQNGASNTYTLAAPVNGSTVQVVLTSSFACATNSPVSSAIYTVTLNASPTVSAAANCNNILTGSGQQVTLTATAAAGSGTIVTYQWILNGSTNVGTNSPTYITTVAGSYTVLVTNSNGCSTTSTVPVVITSSAPPLAAGTYIIPGTGCNGFDKISTAVNYINAHGIAGAVIFGIMAGYSETAPAGGYGITATGTAANTIIFQKNGAGASPVVTAGLQTAGSNNDGIFRIIGGDYISIQDLTLQENAGNTVTSAGATNTMTEWGVALLYAGTTDGPNHNTIQNNIISLNKNYPNSFGVYSNLRHNATTVATQADITNTSGGFNKVYGNAINNVNNPVVFIGSGPAMSPSNDIGGSSAVTTNTISNWGSNTVNSGNSVFFGVSADMNAVYAANQTGLNISWNSITSATGINVSPAAFRGICTDFVGAAPSGTFTTSIGNNTIVLNSAAPSGTFEAISQLNTVSASAVTGITLNITNNIISSALTGTGSSADIRGIANAFPSGVLNISDNIIKGNTSTATTGGFTGILNNGAVSSTMNMNNNQFGDGSTNAVTFSNAGSATVRGISNTAAAAAAILSINNNSFTKFVHTVTGTSDLTLISNTATVATQNISTNSFSNINTNSNGTFTAISATATGSNKVISGNTFNSITGGSGDMTMISASGGSILCNINNNNIGNNVANSISGTGSITGINITATGIATLATNTVTGLSCTGSTASTVTAISSASPTATITSNIINTLSSSGNGAAIRGIYISAGTTVNASLHTIHGLTGTGTGSVSATGIYIAAGTAVNIFKNRIYDLREQNVTAAANPVVQGIRIDGGTNVTAYNNFVSDLKAPVADGPDVIQGIAVTSIATASVYNIYYNSIYLDAGSTGTNFGSSGLFHTGNALATTASLNLRNNIIDNESVAAGTGLTVAYRNGNTNLGNYALTSNNNLYFAGSLATPGPLYHDGINSETTLAGLQARMGLRDGSSVSARPNFISAINLHLVPGANCSADGAGAPIAGITDDIDADSRDLVTPDIGADEFTGTGGAAGVWKGVVNTDWNNINNWCDAIPNAGTNVTIPTGLTNYPVIITGTPVAKNVTIAAGGSITITGVGKLGIYGGITNAGTFNVVDGTIEMLGTSAQTIPANAFQNNDIKNLIISNTAVSPGVTLGGTLKLYGKLSFTGNNKTFTTAGFLTLRSTATGTASVGDITNNNIANSNNVITGDVTVERFITAKRAWRYLSVPTNNNLQTIHEAWQENQAAGSPNPAGYGTQITSNLAGWSAAGFDIYSGGGPSVKTYVPATNSWSGIANTSSPFTTGTGYMTFTRGDRTINTFGPPPNTTVLRDKGALKTYDFVAAPIGAGEFAGIGNPYASAVDFTKLNKTNLQDVYYLWDPQLGTFGGYVTFAGPSYNATASVSYNSGNKYIESGQAFFVKSNGTAGSLTFTEPSKVDGSYLVTRPAGTGKQLRTNLYLVSAGSNSLYDGVLSEFDAGYSATVDVLDATKLVNFGENLAIQAGDKRLSVERRPELSDRDTLYYNLSQLRIQHYQFEFTAERIGQAGLTGFLEDNYLHTSTPVSMDGITQVAFEVTNNADSYAADRFRLVFKQATPVPVTFTSIRANRQNRNILVDWKVENELNIHHYEVERSANGSNFSKVAEQAALGNGSGVALQYSWLDTNPLQGDNFYRVRSIGMSNDAKLSQVVKVNMGKDPVMISVFPNPVSEDGVLYVSLANKPAGEYMVSLVNSEGQVMMKRVLNHLGGSTVYTVSLEKIIAHGNYVLNINDDHGDKQAFKIVY